MRQPWKKSEMPLQIRIALVSFSSAVTIVESLAESHNCFHLEAKNIGKN
jgi:hypothetical protein